MEKAKKNLEESIYSRLKNVARQRKRPVQEVLKSYELSRIETILCRYELWEKNHIIQKEVEDFRLRLYEPSEIEQLLAQENLKIVGRWQAEPYIRIEANNTNPVILYECMRNSL